MRNNHSEQSRVLARYPRSQASVRLFCFPFAGGGAAIYRSWAAQLPSEIDVCPVQLPGREMRLVETPISNLAPLLETLVPALSPYLDQPYAFFGHSMGALISFELTHALAEYGSRLPVRLFLSSHRAPHLPPARSPLYDLPHDDFVQELRNLQGTPEEVLQHKELLELVLPLLRADFELCETYQYSEKKRLDIPMTILGGLEDHDIPRSALQSWQEHTSRECTLRLFKGGHFYLQQEQELLLQVIVKDLLVRTNLKQA